MNKLMSFIKEVLTPEGIKQLIRYLITGFTTFGIEYGLFYVLYKIVGANYLIANCTVYPIIFWLNFTLNRVFSFKSKDNLWRQMKLYSILFFINLFVANIGLMYIFSDLFKINPLISKVLIMFFIVSWNFILYKKVIYR